MDNLFSVVGVVLEAKQSWRATTSASGYAVFTALVRGDNNRIYTLTCESNFQNAGKKHKNGTPAIYVWGENYVKAVKYLQQGTRIKFFTKNIRNDVVTIDMRNIEVL